MKRRNDQNPADSFGKSLLRDCMGAFVKNRDIAQISVQTESCAVSITRNSNGNAVTHAIGFNADWGDEDDDEDEDE